MTGMKRLNVCLLICLLTGMLLARPPAQANAWHWDNLWTIEGTSSGDNLLTRNNGEHALAVTEYLAGKNEGHFPYFLTL